MTADFSQYSELKITDDQTADFTVYGLRGEPTLRMRPATEANKPYYNDFLRRVTGNRRKAKGNKITVDMLDETRARDRQAYPKFVITGWPKPPIDTKGKKVVFSVENCVDFLKAIPDDIFDEIREFALDITNFREDIDAEGAGKNSQSD